MITARNRQHRGGMQALIALFVSSAWLVITSVPLAGAAWPASGPSHHVVQTNGAAHPFGEPTAPLSERHVYDLANVLTPDEAASIESDAARLQRFNVPTLVITVASDMSPDDAHNVAASLRQDWDVETTAGAADGLVFLVSIPASEQGESIAALSWGSNALPHNGINGAAIAEIQQRWIDPWLAESQVFESLRYGLRRLIYHAIYDPAPAAPLSAAQQTAQTITAWCAPLTVIGIGALRLTLPAHLRSRRPEWAPELGLILLALLLAILSVWAHSSIGVACAALLLVAAATQWVRNDPGPVNGDNHLTSVSPAGRGA